jgi:hypothetical protein
VPKGSSQSGGFHEEHSFQLCIKGYVGPTSPTLRFRDTVTECGELGVRRWVVCPVPDIRVFFEDSLPCA